jgi:hypothetical protein
VDCFKRPVEVGLLEAQSFAVVEWRYRALCMIDRL